MGVNYFDWARWRFLFRIIYNLYYAWKWQHPVTPDPQTTSNLIKSKDPFEKSRVLFWADTIRKNPLLGLPYINSSFTYVLHPLIIPHCHSYLLSFSILFQNIYLSQFFFYYFISKYLVEKQCNYPQNKTILALMFLSVSHTLSGLHNIAPWPGDFQVGSAPQREARRLKEEEEDGFCFFPLCFLFLSMSTQPDPSLLIFQHLQNQLCHSLFRGSRTNLMTPTRIPWTGAFLWAQTHSHIWPVPSLGDLSLSYAGLGPQASKP